MTSPPNIAERTVLDQNLMAALARTANNNRSFVPPSAATPTNPQEGGTSAFSSPNEVNSDNSKGGVSSGDFQPPLSPHNDNDSSSSQYLLDPVSLTASEREEIEKNNEPKKRRSSLIRRFRKGGEGDDDLGPEVIDENATVAVDDAEQKAAAGAAAEEERLRAIRSDDSKTLRTWNEWKKGHKTLINSELEKRITAPLFSLEGLFNSATRGISMMQVREQQWYHVVVHQRWRFVFLWSFVMYAAVIFVTALLYGIVMAACGSPSRVITAYYVGVVTAVSNGGYAGESPQATNSATHCFEGRAIVVMIGTYLNICVLSFISAIFIAKASTVKSLRHRIAFSSLALIREVEHPFANSNASTGQPERTPQAVVSALGIRALAARRSDRRRARVQRRLQQQRETDNNPTSVVNVEPDASPSASSYMGASSSGLEQFGSDLFGTAREHRYLSYVLQFRLANLQQSSGYSVLSGELRVFLFTQEIADPVVRSVRARMYELPWSCLNEQHGDAPPAYDTEVAATAGATTKTLRLWFPVTVDIALCAYTENRACRLLHRLLLRHSRGALALAPPKEVSPQDTQSEEDEPPVMSPRAYVGGAGPIDTNVDSIYDFQLLMEYQAQDGGSGGNSFVARRSYGPSTMLRGLRFADTCAFLPSLTTHRVRANLAAATGEEFLYEDDTPPPPPTENEPAVDVDYERFNATTLDD